MKYKVSKKIFRFTFLVFLTAFLVLYFSEGMGYFEYKKNKKSVLTEEKIKEFEQDVAKGKEVDIKDYLPQTENNYQNTISATGLKLSALAENCIKSAVDSSFKALAKLAGS